MRNGDYKPYPENTVRERSGCKVGWRTYATREEAEVCSEAAKHNAKLDAALGYDFGYQAPGSISTNSDGTFTVCIP